jgi:hypothetical protein
MSALREKLARQWLERRYNDPAAWHSSTVSNRNRAMIEATFIIAVFEAEARQGNLPSELLSAVDDGRDVAAARRLAKGDAK